MCDGGGDVGGESAAEGHVFDVHVFFTAVLHCVDDQYEVCTNGSRGGCAEQCGQRCCFGIHLCI